MNLFFFMLYFLGRRGGCILDRFPTDEITFICSGTGYLTLCRYDTSTKVRQQID